MIALKDQIKVDEKELEKDFNQAMKQKEFQNFIAKIHISSTLAMKYTSDLEESCQEFCHCLSCNGIQECQNKIFGYAYLPKVYQNSLQFSYKPCRYKQKQDKAHQYLKNIRYYFVPEALKDATFDKIDKRYVARNDAILWLNTFLKNYPNVEKGLYLSGNFGCGKTYMITATFSELAKKNIKSAIVFWPEFLRDLKSSFDTDYDEKMKYIKNVAILCIDDIGAEVVTPWARDEILCPILQYRMESKLPTFFTSNFSMEELEQHLSTTKEGVEIVKAKRIMERIKQLSYEMNIISKNMRK